MPFGKRWLTLAVEGESKQSCVIFAVYFMSLHIAIGGDSKSIVITNCMQKKYISKSYLKSCKNFYEIHTLCLFSVRRDISAKIRVLFELCTLFIKKYSVGCQYSSTLVVVCLNVVGFVFRFC